MDTSKWVDPNRHGWIIRPQGESDWHALAAHYGGKLPTPLARTLEAVRAAGCQTIVVENRYVDLDYRSEFSAFWSQRFQGTSGFTRRLHFFSSRISDDQLHRIPGQGYLGYAVVRPIPFGSLGRTMIVPPPNVRTATLALAHDEITLFGNRLHIEAAPFCQQDGEFLRCAHASAWMCHYSAACRGLVGRQRTANLVAAAPRMLSAERSLPSKGMTLLQLQAVFDAFEQPALFYGLSTMPRVAGVDDPVAPPRNADGQTPPPGKWDTRVFSVVCRYVNSGYPVFIATEDHAFVIVGWYRDGDWIRFIANDDQRGPYQVIDSPFDDERGIWQAIMVPLPPRVFLSGEAAENQAHFTFRALGSHSGVSEDWTAIAAGVADKSISLRTLLRDASEYKVELEKRGLDEAVIRHFRLARLPHYVWIVEAHDRAARAAGKPCVLAEVVFDSTSNDFEPRMDALLMPTLAMTYPPDQGQPVAVAMGRGAWASSLHVGATDLAARLKPAV